MIVSSSSSGRAEFASSRTAWCSGRIFSTSARSFPRRAPSGSSVSRSRPDYATTGLFYVYYIDNDDDSVVARYQVSAQANVANPVGEIVLEIPQTFLDHNGGTIAFSPVDGYLYLAPGDGGGGPFRSGRTRTGQAVVAGQDAAHRRGGRRRYDVQRSARQSVRRRSDDPRRDLVLRPPKPPIASASTANRGTCGSATWARKKRRKSSSSRRTAAAGTTAGTSWRERSAS